MGGVGLSEFVISAWTLVVLGDFNPILDLSDRVGGTDKWPPSFDDLHNCLVDSGLDDLRYTGARCTV